MRARRQPSCNRGGPSSKALRCRLRLRQLAVRIQCKLCRVPWSMTQSRRKAPLRTTEESGASMRILPLEDHDRLAQTIVDGLSEFGFGVDAVATAEDGIGATRSLEYDAIILDLGLPDRDGLEVISELRGRNVGSPILILTARDGVDDRVAGLDRGGDDYLLKPFAMKELAARLRAVLRRPGRALGAVLESGNVCVDTVLHQVEVNGSVAAISRR